MSVFITLLAALFVFSAVIAIHEFGHFAVAKLCGVQVNEFSIGMGPALWKTVRKGTQYTLRALPVGGYVALEGEESPESQQAEAARDQGRKRHPPRCRRKKASASPERGPGLAADAGDGGRCGHELCAGVRGAADPAHGPELAR